MLHDLKTAFRILKHSPETVRPRIIPFHAFSRRLQPRSPHYELQYLSLSMACGAHGNGRPLI